MSTKKSKNKKNDEQNLSYQMPQDDIIHTEHLAEHLAENLQEDLNNIANDEANPNGDSQPMLDEIAQYQVEIGSLSTRIAELEQEVEEAKDKMLRVAAEAENIRKRAQREKEDANRYAISDFAKELLPVSDNMMRALQAVKEEDRAIPQLSSLLEGIDMTNHMLQDCFIKFNLKKVGAIGDKFSHNHHQAVQQLESDEHESGTIIQVLQEGYIIHDRLLRPAMVIVAK